MGSDHTYLKKSFHGRLQNLILNFKVTIDYSYFTSLRVKNCEHPKNVL